MIHEAPKRTSEQIAAGLVAQALTAQQEGLEKEIPVYLKVSIDSPSLAARFKVPDISGNPILGDMLDRLLVVNDDFSVSYVTGFNSYDGHKYEHWITPSKRYPGLFTITEFAMKGRQRVAERVGILVSGTNLIEFQNWSHFFYNVIQKEA